MVLLRDQHLEFSHKNTTEKRSALKFTKSQNLPVSVTRLRRICGLAELGSPFHNTIKKVKESRDGTFQPGCGAAVWCRTG